MTTVKKGQNINLSLSRLLRVWFSIRYRRKWLSIMIADRNRFDREHVVLAALAASEGAILEPVHVQKLFFLVDNKIPELIDGPHFDFIPYAYGPFDKAVYSVLEVLERQGFVEIVREPTSRYRRYRLTPLGQRRGNEVLANMPDTASNFLRRLSQFITRLSFAELVSAIYDAYPAMRENSVFVRYS